MTKRPRLGAAYFGRTAKGRSGCRPGSQCKMASPLSDYSGSPQVNQFVATAVAEKLAAMGTAEFFAERRARADFTAFDRLMRRKGGEPPAPDDTIA